MLGCMRSMYVLIYSMDLYVLAMFRHIYMHIYIYMLICNITYFKSLSVRSLTIRGMPKTLETLAFEVYDYLRHFLSSCVQLTSLEISAHSVDATSIGGCIVTCATVPIGISPEEFLQVLRKTEVKQQIEQLHEQHLDIARIIESCF